MRIVFLVGILFLTATVASGRMPATRPVPQNLGEALADALAGKTALDDVQISAQGFAAPQGRTATIWGDGDGVWNSSVQIHLSQKQLMAALRAFDAAGFTSMPAQFGQVQMPPGMMRPIRVDGTVMLRIGALSKAVMQIDGGPQSPELAKLAGTLLAPAQVAAKDGQTAANLSDALGKLEAGTLSPHQLQVMVHRLPKQGGGFLLRIDGRNATIEEDGIAGVKTNAALSDAQWKKLTAALVAADVADLPINCYGPAYTDLSVAVLDQSKNLQARADFAKVTPTTYGKRQEAFDRLYQALDELHKQLAQEAKQPKEQL